MPTPLTLGKNDVHVWLSVPETVCDDEVLKACETLLSPDEQRRRRRLRFARHRHEFLVSHALVRSTLSRYAPVGPGGWRFVTNAHQRPEIGNHGHRDLHFNLSHTEGLVAVAVTRRREVGVDVESFDRRRINLEVARRFFAPVEADALFALPAERQPHRFLQLWTLKESYIKARGMGLALPLRHFSFSDVDESPSISFSGDIDDRPSRWQFRVRQSGQRHMLALAVEAAPAERLGIEIREVAQPIW